eukprot:GHVH01000224.1.p1 GENE.GHVH01000224.1~~GHVH01000224.1.p1  ORF type:complete len:106 (+),score=17.63 GHVH01000224.1:90-407(+)
MGIFSFLSTCCPCVVDSGVRVGMKQAQEKKISQMSGEQARTADYSMFHAANMVLEMFNRPMIDDDVYKSDNPPNFLTKAVHDHFVKHSMRHTYDLLTARKARGEF